MGRYNAKWKPGLVEPMAARLGLLVASTFNLVEIELELNASNLLTAIREGKMGKTC